MNKLIKKNYLILVVSVIILSFILYPTYFQSRYIDYNKYTVVEVAKAKYSSWQQDIDLVGHIVAEQYINFVAEIPGIIKRIADPTQQVASGELIAVLENTPISKRFNLNNHDYSKFIAPFSGIVGNYQVKNRTLVSPGQPIVSLINHNSLTVSFKISTLIAKQIAINQKVVINNQDFYIKRISQLADPKTNLFTATVNYTCTKCNPGETVIVQLILKQKPNVLLIPQRAIFTINQQPHVYLAEHNRAILRSVSLGLQSQGTVEITNGIKENDLVIVSNIEKLENYSKINYKNI